MACGRFTSRAAEEKRSLSAAVRMDGGTKKAVLTRASRPGREKKRTSMKGRFCTRLNCKTRRCSNLKRAAASFTPFPSRKSSALIPSWARYGLIESPMLTWNRPEPLSRSTSSWVVASIEVVPGAPGQGQERETDLAGREPEAVPRHDRDGGGGGAARELLLDLGEGDAPQSHLGAAQHLAGLGVLDLPALAKQRQLEPATGSILAPHPEGQRALLDLQHVSFDLGEEVHQLIGEHGHRDGGARSLAGGVGGQSLLGDRQGCPTGEEIDEESDQKPVSHARTIAPRPGAGNSLE